MDGVVRLRAEGTAAAAAADAAGSSARLQEMEALWAACEEYVHRNRRFGRA